MKLMMLLCINYIFFAIKTKYAPNNYVWILLRIDAICNVPHK